jgi:hypothetical protein
MKLLSTGTKDEKRRKLGILFDFWWAIWKERNRCIFENKCMLAQHLAFSLKDEVRLHLSVLRPGG